MSIFQKSASVLVGSSLIVLSISPVFAESTSDTSSATSAGTARTKIIQRKAGTIKPDSAQSIADLKAKLASAAAEARAKLKAFKDQKKVIVAERLNTNLNAINQNQTKQMQKHISVMSAILDKLEGRVNKATSDIKDPEEAKFAITTARASISSASAALSAQSLKDYTIQVSTEGRLRQDAKVRRDRLHEDLLSVRKLVKEAKQSVANAIRIAKSGKVEIPKAKEGTASGQQ